MRIALGFFALLALAAGCHRAAPTGKATPAAPAAPAADLRTYKMDEVELFLRGRLRDDTITLTSGANGKFKGTRKAPDGTAVIPIDVTVEMDRAIIEARAPGLMSRDTVPLAGEIKSDLR